MKQSKSIVLAVLILGVALSGCGLPSVANQVAGGRAALPRLAAQWPVEGVPGAIAAGPDGTVYVTINNSHRVVRYSPSGEPLAEWLIEGQATAIAAGPEGTVYVTINNSHRVVQYGPQGELLGAWAVPCRECGAIETNGIAVGPDGSVYVTINNSHRVVHLSATGEYRGEWTFEGEAAGIAAGPEGLVYIADWTGSQVLAFQAQP